MTSEQKERVLDLRRNGFSYVDISAAVGLHINTVKTFYRRNRLASDSVAASLPVNTTDPEPGNIPAHPLTESQLIFQDGICRQCGAALIQQLKTKPRFFCDAKCGSAWRYRHRSDQAGKSTVLTCARCGNRFYAYGTNHRKYCSHSCYIKDRFMEGTHRVTGGSHIDKRAV
jgi:DNA-directed RNA polymerase subunit M/transcription elongation factor TFIIS